MPSRAPTAKKRLPTPRRRAPVRAVTRGKTLRAPKLVFADDAGNLYDHPTLDAVIPEGRFGVRPAPPEAFRPAPPNGVSANVAMLPGRVPVGADPKTGRIEVVDSIVLGGRRVRPIAVAALLPPGWTRTHLPAFKAAGLAPVLPLYGYAAAGWRGGELVAAGLRTDPRDHWDPRLFSTADLEARIRTRLAEDPTNRVLLQVARCAHEYRCFTAQNVFYRRWEGAIPMSPACNAQCVGCISEQDPETGPPPSQWRITEGPSAEECVRMSVAHLEGAGDGAIVSWGQGCEGEPTLRAAAMADAIRAIRRKTKKGTLHVNTNGSLPDALVALKDAGLDSCRVSLNVAEKTVYEAYYRPTGYTWEDVARGVKEAKRAGLFVSLNLLTFPGVNDLPAQADALRALVSDAKPDMIQTRTLCIDPDSYFASLPPDQVAAEPIGLERLLKTLLLENPGLKIGNYNVPREEWARPLVPPDL